MALCIDKSNTIPYNTFMLCDTIIANLTAFPNNRRSPAVPTLIVLLVFSATFLVKSANAQPSADPSAYRLIGTVMAGALTGAVLGYEKGEQTFYRLNEALPDESKIVKVQSDSIQIKRSDGVIYEMYINHDMMVAAQQASPQVANPPPPDIAPSVTQTSKELPRKQRHLKRSSEDHE
jgi:type II secretory pathway component PulC